MGTENHMLLLKWDSKTFCKFIFPMKILMFHPNLYLPAKAKIYWSLPKTYHGQSATKSQLFFSPPEYRGNPTLIWVSPNLYLYKLTKPTSFKTGGGGSYSSPFPRLTCNLSPGPKKRHVSTRCNFKRRQTTNDSSQMRQWKFGRVFPDGSAALESHHPPQGLELPTLPNTRVRMALPETAKFQCWPPELGKEN